MEHKVKNINVCVGMSRKSPDLAVIMGIHFKCDWSCLTQLKNNITCDTVYNGAEDSALAYALFEHIRDKFIGSPLELSKSRVSRVSCDSQNGKFVISWNTQGSLSTLRRTIAVALASLTPMKLYSKYAENMKLLGGKSDRACFNHSANSMANAIKSNISIVAVGKIKMDAAKLKDLVNRVSIKIPKQETPPAKEITKPEKRKDYSHTFPVVKASGIAAVLVADYIRSKSGGMAVELDSDRVVVYNKSWEVKHKALKQAARINDYVRTKYEKLGKDFPCILAYYAITQEFTDCDTVSKILKTKLTPSNAKDLLKKAM